MGNFIFENTIGYTINRTAIRMRNELWKKFKEKGFDITIDHWIVLNRLWDEDGWTQSELAMMTYKDKANITRILDAMAKRDLIERKPDLNDRRVFRVHLTEKGKKLKKPLTKMAVDNMNQGLRGISPKDVEYIKDILNQMHDNYD